MDETEDAELKELLQTKANLVKKLLALRKQIQNQKKPGAKRRKVSIEKILEPIIQPQRNSTSCGVSSKEGDLLQANLISQRILGIGFRDIQKNWLHGNVYRYEATVDTKALYFALELTIEIMESNSSFTFHDITCHFINVDKCYITEVSPWTQRFTRDKNFMYLMTAFSSYSEQSAIRTKLLKMLESMEYATIEKCNDEDGGLYIYIHPAGIEEQIFFKFQWFTKFVDKSWQVEHFFSINPVSADERFVKENKAVLEGFCRLGLEKSDLENLWSELCMAIDIAGK